MSYSSQTNVSNIDIGTLLKIVSTRGVYNNLSTASEIWKYFLRQRAAGGPNGGREMRYSIRTAYGAPAFQSLPAGSSGDYPAGVRGEFPEATAHFKDHGLTINIPRNLINKTGPDLLQYADPIAEEMDGKVIVAARVLSAQCLGDGSGSIGKAGAIAVDTTNDQIVVTLSTLSADAGRSHIGWFEYKDRVKFAAAASTAHGTINNTGTSVGYWLVTDVNVELDKVTLKPYTSADVAIDITTATLGATDPTVSDYIYRQGTTPNDLTAISTNDWETLSEVLVGLEALAADSASVKVHGITRTGASSGSRLDVLGASLDSIHFQKALSKGKRRCGKGRYAYREAFMHDTSLDALVESRESDRRFQTVEDGKRGVKVMGYQHGKDFVEFSDDEFVQKPRIWMPPESKDVLTFHGGDMELVEINPGQKFHLKTSSTGAGHSRQQQAYMEGVGLIVCKHPAAVICIENFTIAS